MNQKRIHSDDHKEYTPDKIYNQTIITNWTLEHLSKCERLFTYLELIEEINKRVFI